MLAIIQSEVNLNHTANIWAKESSSDSGDSR